MLLRYEIDKLREALSRPERFSPFELNLPRLRFGLGEDDPLSLAATAGALGCEPAFARAAERRVLRRLRVELGAAA